METIKLKTLGAWILMLSLLLDNMFLPFNLGFDFRAQYVIFILMIPFYLIFFKININPKIAGSVLVVALFLFITPLFAGTPLVGSARQVLLIFICFIPFYLMLASYHFEVTVPFKIYLSTSLLVSLLAIVQFFSFILKFKPGYDFSYLLFDMSRLDASTYRVQGTMMEPSFLAYFIMPAAFFSIVRLFNVYKSEIRFGKTSCVIILAALLLTSSLIAYVAIVLMLVVISIEKYPLFKNPFTLLLVSVIIISISISLYSLSKAVKRRVDDTVGIFTNAIDLRKVNLSTGHFYNNFLVTSKAIAQYPLTGVGFGNFYVMHDKFALPMEEKNKNTPDGSSLFFRLITETGVPFTLFFVLFVFRYKLKMTTALIQHEFKDIWIINNAVFVLIIMRLIRMPHYTVLGLPLFIILYCLCFRQARKYSDSQV